MEDDDPKIHVKNIRTLYGKTFKSEENCVEIKMLLHILIKNKELTQNKIIIFVVNAILSKYR